MSSDMEVLNPVQTLKQMVKPKIPLYCGFSPRPKNKYSATQAEGNVAKARRMRQIEKGMIKV